MGTKVIDKLRIQGSAAPRYAIEAKKPNANNEFLEEPANFLLQEHSGKRVSRNPPSNPSSAASRRLDFLERVQQANRGLTNYDYFTNQSNPGLPNLQFMLRGKPVQGEYEFTPYDASAHQRVGHYKASAKEVYKARHKMNDIQPETQDHAGMYRAVRSAEYGRAEKLRSSQAHAEPKSGSSQMYYLGPPASAPEAKKSYTSGQCTKLPPTPAPSMVREDYSMGSAVRPTRQRVRYGDTLTLQGQQLHTPRAEYLEDDCELISHLDLMTRALNRTHDISSHTPSSIMSRRQKTWPRTTNPKENMPSATDMTLLKQCLQVQQTQHQAGSVTSPRDVVKLKHFTQYVRKEDKNHRVNYNNPYRNLRAKERKALNSEYSGKYMFNSVDSYIHFNKIYPRLGYPHIEKNGSSTKLQPASTVPGMPQIPQVDGFSNHCTDTVLLKMMFEMNRPKSIRSTSKYSDVAMHKDLEEFMVVGTPSVSRSPSVLSRSRNRKSRSMASGGTLAHKEIAEDGGPTKALAEAVEKYRIETEETPLLVENQVDEGIEVEILSGDELEHRGDENHAHSTTDAVKEQAEETGREEDSKSDSHLEQLRRDTECYSSSSASSARQSDGYGVVNDAGDAIET